MYSGHLRAVSSLICTGALPRRLPSSEALWMTLLLETGAQLEDTLAPHHAAATALGSPGSPRYIHGSHQLHLQAKHTTLQQRRATLLPAEHCRRGWVSQCVPGLLGKGVAGAQTLLEGSLQKGDLRGEEVRQHNKNGDHSFFVTTSSPPPPTQTPNHTIKTNKAALKSPSVNTPPHHTPPPLRRPNERPPRQMRAEPPHSSPMCLK